MKNVKIFFIVCIFLSFGLNAAKEKGSSRIDLKNYSASNNLLYLQDDKFNTVNSFVTSGTPMGFFDHTYRNKLVLGIDKYVTSIGAPYSSLPGGEYTAEVLVKLSSNQLSGSSFVGSSVLQKLTVNFKGQSTQAAVNNGATEVDLDSYVYFSAYNTLVNILSVTIYDKTGAAIASSAGYPDNLYLELEYEAERYYDMQTNAVPFSLNNQGFFRYYNSGLNGNQIEFNWQPIAGAEEYDLEWLWLDEYTYNGIGSVVNPVWNKLAELDFRNNSTRVRTDNNFYRINNAFESGYLFFRVRGVGITKTLPALVALGNDPLTEYYTPWTWEDKSSLVASGSAINPSSFSFGGIISSIGSPVLSIPVGGGLSLNSSNVPWFINLTGLNTQFETDKNWVYKATYAEEGKKKEVVSFFDGGQYNRQTVTINNSDKVAVVAETYYDFIGRASVSALPTPVDDARLKFYQTTVSGKNGFNFENVSSSPNPFTKEVFATTPIMPSCSALDVSFNNNYGTAKYYSSNNPFINTLNPFYNYYNIHANYVPDAQNYPFTKTEFINDNTGKISQQSGVGPTFKINDPAPFADKHTTRYLYSVPEQEELDRLFGSESGYANRYTKVVTIDANGQASISYKDDYGKVVATALSGAKPTNLNSLMNSNGIQLDNSPFPMLNNLLNKINDNDVDKPSDNNIREGDALIFSKKITVTSAQTYSFDFNLKGANFTTTCTPVCFDCAYDLTFDIIDKCGNRPPGLSGPITYSLGKIVSPGGPSANSIVNVNTACDEPVNFMFSQILPSSTNSLAVALDVGEYTVYKKLTVNQTVLSQYLDSYIATCAKPYQDFLNDEMATLDATGCNDMTCQQCSLKVGTLANYLLDHLPLGYTSVSQLSPFQNDSIKSEYDNLIASCLEPCSYISSCEASFMNLLEDVSPSGQYAEFEGPSNTVDPSLYALSILNPSNNFSKKTSLGNQPNWREPVHFKTLVAKYFDDNNASIPSKVKVVLDPVTLTYNPPVLNTSIPSALAPVDVSNGIYETDPTNLTNVTDFISNWKPTWAKSLVTYHPEYCYYEWCKGNATPIDNISISAYPPVNFSPANPLGYDFSASPTTINVKSSDDYDSLLVTLDDIDGIATADLNKILDPLNNDPYWKVGIGGKGQYVFSNSPSTSSSLVSELQQTGSNTINYASSSNFPLPFKLNYKPVNTEIFNYQNSGLNLWQFCAIISTTVGANLGQTPAQLLSLMNSYSGYASTPTTNVEYLTKLSNNEERRAAWENFRSMYLALKQAKQTEAAQSFVMNSNCRGCNDCIGKPNFDPTTVEFIKYHAFNSLFVFPPAFPAFINSFLSDWYYPTTTLNQQQHCGYATASLYTGKTKRFYNMQDAKNAGGGSTSAAQANIYNTTGLCPIGYYFQNFLNDLVDPGSGNSVVANNSNVTANVPAFNQDLYLAINGGNYGSPLVTYAPSVSSNILTGAISIASGNTCAFTLQMPTAPLGYPPGIVSWANYQGTTPSYQIIGFSNLTVTGANSFSIKAKIVTTGASPVQYDLTLTGTTCSNLALDGCNFEPPCVLNANGKYVRDLLNAIAANHELDNTTPITIGGGTSAGVGSPYNVIFNNGIKPFLDLTSSTNTWTWTLASTSPFTYIIGDNPSSSSNNKIKITITSALPAINTSILNCITSIQNFKVDPNVNGGVMFDAVIANAPGPPTSCSDGTYKIKATIEYGTNLLGTLNPYNVGNCSLTLLTCNTTEHLVKNDLEAMVMSPSFQTTLSTSSSINITSNSLLTLLLRSYLGPVTPLSVTAPVVTAPGNFYHWVKDATSTPSEVKAWLVTTNSSAPPAAGPYPSNTPKFTFRFKSGQSTGTTLVESYSGLSNFVVKSAPLINNNSFEFEALGTYGASTYTVEGITNVFPMKSCATCTNVSNTTNGSIGNTYVVNDFTNPITYSIVFNSSPTPTPYTNFNLNIPSVVLDNGLKLAIPPNQMGLTVNFNNPPACGPSPIIANPFVPLGKGYLAFNSNHNPLSCPVFNPMLKTVLTLTFTPPFTGSFKISHKVIPGSLPQSNGTKDYFLNGSALATGLNLFTAPLFQTTSGIPMIYGNIYELKLEITNSTTFNHLVAEQLELINTTANTLTVQIPCVATPWPTDTMPTVEYEEPCQPFLEDIAANNAEVKYNQYLDDLKSDFIANYTKHCMDNAIENLYMKYNNTDYHFTLYYYDQAGNLVRTVPPEGVKLIMPGLNGYASNVLDVVKQERDGYGTVTKTVFNKHNLFTTYTYNSLNQLVKQITPDAGTSLFYYDNLGRLCLSQNAEQANLSSGIQKQYSYTNYDALGRIAEVGKLSTQVNILTVGNIPNYLSNPNFPAAMASVLGARLEVTSTYYGDEDGFTPIPPSGLFENGFQQNLRGRVATVTIEDAFDGNPLTYNHGTHYSYDVHGNVKELIQDNMEFATGPLISQRFKSINYTYDLISGKVNTVTYQRNGLDRFMHKYLYDAENRITNVFTSRNYSRWEQDAKYQYYLHGPLARVETGEHKVQSSDFAYTLQGWIKGVNSNVVNPLNDAGKDGFGNLGASGVNNFNARDGYGYSLNYYESIDNSNVVTNDYLPVNSALYASTPTYFLAKLSNLSAYGATGYPQLYNGNISSMSTAYMNLDPSLTTIPNTSFPLSKYQNYSQLKMFQYDQLNRINTAFAISNYINPTNDWSLIPPASITQFAEGFSYDQNGNILTAHRNTSTPGASATLDDLQYHYYTAGGAIYIPSATSPADATNKLAYVTDNIASANTDDIETQPINNYTYDGIGNLTSDKYENISNISWTTYGKIKQITYLPVANKPNILFKYDAAGNRISKELVYATGSRNTTYYIRDAQGNVMATYYKDVRIVGPNTITTLNLNELHLYGSSRLGIFNANNQMHLDINGSSVLVNGFTQINSRTLGTKTYELSNHLGNVLTVVTDRKIPIDNNTDGVTDYYLSDIINTTDYYAFGSPMPGRLFNSSSYRYGFNGKENDNEVKGVQGSQQDYGMRIYDPRLGKFLSVDPLRDKFPWWSPYAFAGNSPIMANDLDGAETDVKVASFESGKVKLQTTHNHDLNQVAMHLVINASKNPFHGQPEIKLGVEGQFGWAFVGNKIIAVYAQVDKDGDISVYRFDQIEIDRAIDQANENNERIQAGFDAFLSTGKSSGGKSSNTKVNVNNKVTTSTKQFSTSRAARRAVMREQGIPTSMQPESQSSNASGREYTYRVAKKGGGTELKSVQQQTMDRSHAGESHWEAGLIKQRDGATQYNQYDRPKLENEPAKSKAIYENK